MGKEATARIKINRLLEAAGWRFFDNGNGPANICLEPSVNLEPNTLSDLGEDFERSGKGFVDFLMLDAKGFPLMVLEAKAEDKDPLIGKEQARTYAKSQNCRFVILSNGNLHYFWDLQQGNPQIITSFPAPESVVGYKNITRNPQALIDEHVAEDYVVQSQSPHYESDARWQDKAQRTEFVSEYKLRFLRPYQLSAIHSLQRALRDGKKRFLFEMATGTGKTLTAAAVMKLFLSTGNARRVLFLVDRLELEEQAQKAFAQVLSADYRTAIFKDNREDWRKAEIVVTTVQSVLFNNKYQTLFSPTDFDLVISDEAHRSLSGNARAVFEYFLGYKLGLTATPRDYLRTSNSKTSSFNDPRAIEQRLLLDTYRTFGCDSGDPTFRYSLLDGVKDGYLISPTLIDARTEVTTQLLSDEGFTVAVVDDTGESQQETFKQREFERRFFSETTNQLFSRTFLEHALRDPVSGEIGKSIVFAVSQVHASKLTQIMNHIADKMYPGKYSSDFAVQVTSSVPDAQQLAIGFANNNLLGAGNMNPSYRTSKARVCVTVGMMTTGYDCSDILNIGLFRPIFSPTDFIQMKGRGTRKHDFSQQAVRALPGENMVGPFKTTFKIIDFFANCEYFESKYQYDEVLKLPRLRNSQGASEDGYIAAPAIEGSYEHLAGDILAGIKTEVVGSQGMKIDRMFIDHFRTAVRSNGDIADAIATGHWDRVIDLVNREVFDKPEEYFNLEKLQAAASVDRKISLREILEKVFDLIPHFKSRDEWLEEEFNKFLVNHVPEPRTSVLAIKQYFKAYASSSRIREIIDHRQYADLATSPIFSTSDYKAVPEPFRSLVPIYVNDYISLDELAS